LTGIKAQTFCHFYDASTRRSGIVEESALRDGSFTVLEREETAMRQTHSSNIVTRPPAQASTQISTTALFEYPCVTIVTPPREASQHD